MRTTIFLLINLIFFGARQFSGLYAYQAWCILKKAENKTKIMVRKDMRRGGGGGWLNLASNSFDRLAWEDQAG